MLIARRKFLSLVAAPLVANAVNLMPLRGIKMILTPPTSYLDRILKHWILDDENNIVECVPGLAGIKQWGEFFARSDKRRIATGNVGEVSVSTVFLGIDHSFGGDVPILFETMVFGGRLNEHQDRYATYAEAKAGHEEMVRRVRTAERLRLIGGGRDDS